MKSKIRKLQREKSLLLKACEAAYQLGRVEGISPEDVDTLLLKAIKTAGRKPEIYLV